MAGMSLLTFLNNDICVIHNISQVVIGESYGMDMTYDLNSLFFMHFVGTVSCTVWKCSRA